MPLLAACETGQQAQVNGPQRYEYAEVKRRVKQLPRGATTIEVLVALGSPAEQRADHWIYLPERTGLIIPAEYLRVNFRGSRYYSHEFKPVILGEQVR